MKAFTALGAPALFAALILLLAGCGGGGSTPTAATGRVAFTVRWPSDASRLPQGTNYVKVDVFDPVQDPVNPITSGATCRPPAAATGTVAFTNLPVGNLRFVINAYAIPGGCASPATILTNLPASLASTTLFINLHAGDNPNQPTVTLDSTANSVATSGNTTLIPGTASDTTTIKATVVDAAGMPVPVADGTVTFSVDNASILQLTDNKDKTATVKGLIDGNATVTVTYFDREVVNGKTIKATVPIAVTKNANSVSVTADTLPPGTASVVFGPGSVVAVPTAGANGSATTSPALVLPVGTQTVTATAFSAANGAGVPLGSASSAVSVPSQGAGTSATLHLSSNVTNLAVSVATNSGSLILAGDTGIQANVTATVDGVQQTLSPGAFTWSISDPTVATVAANSGSVSAVKQGVATISAAPVVGSGTVTSFSLSVHSATAGAGGNIQ